MNETKKSSYLIIALEKLLKRETLSCIEAAKNSNQYFHVIKNNGIALVEVWKPNLVNRGRHLERSLSFTDENVRNVKEYLKRLKGEV